MSPVSIFHPSAPAPESSREKTPKYLIRKDGVVLHYHPALARLGTFEPADELPDWHVRRVEAAARAAEELRRVREARRGVEDANEEAAARTTVAANAKGTAAEGGRLDYGVRRNDGVKGAARKRHRAGAR